MGPFPLWETTPPKEKTVHGETELLPHAWNPPYLSAPVAVAEPHCWEWITGAGRIS